MARAFYDSYRNVWYVTSIFVREITDIQFFSRCLTPLRILARIVSLSWTTVAFTTVKKSGRWWKTCTVSKIVIVHYTLLTRLSV